MKTPWKERTRDCVATARFLLYAVLLFSVFVQTKQQQRDITSKWNNRLLPTNSVYEQRQEFASTSVNVPSIRSLNENNVVENSKGVDRSSSVESAEEGEEFYDDDYELEQTEEDDTRHYSASPSPQHLNHQEDDEKNKKLSPEQSKDQPINHEDFYNYYDDYENTTSPENEAAEKSSIEYVDISEEISASSSSEKHRTTLETSHEKNLKNERLSDSLSSEESLVPDDSRNDDSVVGDKKYSAEDRDSQDGQILIGEAVVSVVTTKSVVNGTISVPVSPLPMTTEQILAPTIPSSTPNPGMDFSAEKYLGDEIDTTEDSRIVASVQTSRSISGARFLPFSIVEGVNKNVPDDNVDKTQLFETVGDKLEKQILSSSTTKKTSLSPESTESIIDKLDRVQSELSSGFLAGGFRTSGNTLQLDVLSEQRPPQTRKSYTTTSKAPVISKFVPRRYNQEKKASTVLPATANTAGKITEVSLSSEKEDDSGMTTEKIKFRWPSSSRNSRPSTTESHLGRKNDPRNFGLAVKQGSTRAPSLPSTVQDISVFLPPGYKLKKEDASVTESSLLSEILAKSKFDISSLLPANYSPKVGQNKFSEETMGADNKNIKDEPAVQIPIEKNLETLFAKTQVNVSSLLPTNYTNDKRKIIEVTKAPSTKENSRGSGSAQPEKSLHDLFSKTNVDISALLPPGYNRFKKDETAKTEKSPKVGSEISSEAPTISMSPGTTAKPAGGIKLVFPSRPGGRKALPKVTTHSSRGDSAGGNNPLAPKIQKGWPVRATTEFTGWPTPSTTPISIEKLLEAARTATIASTNLSATPTTSTSSTTTTTTTTTTTPRPTTPGICEDECEVAGTIRIVGNTTWVPELLDRNTQEWQLLAEQIEKEMNIVFVKSSVLRKWYKRIRIDAFSPGSILVDYFIELTDLRQRINTQELKVIFHDSLRTYNSEKWNETRTKGPIRLGEFALDPKSTDFVVIPKVSAPQHIGVDDRLIPQWAIAVIVIGVGGLLFIIVFGVSVLVNRQNAARLKPSPVVYTEEVAKSMIQASHGAPSHRSSQDYPKSEISTIWNDTDVWRDKSFESNSNEVLVDGTLGHERNVERRIDERKYNMYDSWRSEWNGYYYNQSHGSSKFAGYESTTNLSRHPPDYDTNF